jgi:hypothetical protein
MRRRFGSWHEPIPELLSRIEPTRLLRNYIYDLPPLKNYVAGPFSSATHAMTSALGRGGCPGDPEDGSPLRPMEEMGPIGCQPGLGLLVRP